MAYTTIGRTLKLVPVKHAKMSTSAEESRLLSIQLYRQTAKMIPSILRAYEFESFDVKRATRNIRSRFEKYRDVRDIQVADLLRYKGEIELNETVNMFKTKDGIAEFIAKPVPLPKKDKSEFLDDFLHPIKREKLIDY